MRTFFKKLEYCFLVETTEIESTSFPFKTALSENNIKTNRMATTKWTKAWSFASNYFILLEYFCQFQNLLKRVKLMHQQPKCPYLYFSLALEFNFRVLFPVSILKNEKREYFGGSLKNLIFRREVTKRQYREENRLKWGAWTFCVFKKRDLAIKKGVPLWGVPWCSGYHYYTTSFN